MDTAQNERILEELEQKKERARLHPLPFPVRIAVALFVFLLAAALFAAFAWRLFGKEIPEFAVGGTGAAAGETETLRTVVLDPGHGGSDPGAISAGGVKEKDLNLALAEKTAAILRAEGVRVVMTRETDEMLRSASGRGGAKAQDLLGRVETARGAGGDSVFVSIHMNSLPAANTRGLQVFYSANDPRSQVLAQALQDLTRAALQPENARQIKKAGSSIFVLDRLEIPAVLVECGFLSNEEDTLLLCDPDYQTRLAAVLAASILGFLGNG